MARFGGKFGSPSLAVSASMVLFAAVRGVRLLERFARGDETGDPRSWLAAGKAPPALVPRFSPMQRQVSPGALSARAVLLPRRRVQLPAADALRGAPALPFTSPHEGPAPTSLPAAELVHAQTRGSVASPLASPAASRTVASRSTSLRRVQPSRFSRGRARDDPGRARKFAQHRLLDLTLSQKRSFIIAGSPCFFVRLVGSFRSGLGQHLAPLSRWCSNYNTSSSTRLQACRETLQSDLIGAEIAGKRSGPTRRHLVLPLIPPPRGSLLLRNQSHRPFYTIRCAM